MAARKEAFCLQTNNAANERAALELETKHCCRRAGQGWAGAADSVRGSGVREREMGKKDACIPARCLSLFGVTGLYIQKVKDELMSRPFSQTTILFHHIRPHENKITALWLLACVC